LWGRVQKSPWERAASAVKIIRRISCAPAALTGTLNNTRNTFVALTFYTNPTADGEGQEVQQTVEVVTDASGNATFAVTLPDAGADDYVTATATSIRFKGDTFAVNPSEFSAPVTAGPRLVAAGAEDDEGGL
jgi:hypothetical protein